MQSRSGRKSGGLIRDFIPLAAALFLCFWHVTSFSADIETAIVANEVSNDSARASLENAEKSLSEQDVTLALLEQSRLDVETAQAAVKASNSAIEDLAAKLTDSQKKFESLTALLRQQEAADDVDATKLTESRRNLEALKTEVEELTAEQAQLNELRAARRTAASIAAQRLDLLRSRFDIATLDIPAETPDPERLGLQKKAKRYSEEARNFRARLIVSNDDSAAGKAQRQLIELQAQNAEERAELARLQLSLNDEQAAILALQRLSDATALPAAALSHAKDKAESLRELVRDKRQRLLDRVKRLERQIGIATERAEFTNASPRLLVKQGALLNGLLDATRATLKQSDDVAVAADSVARHYSHALQRSLRRDLVQRRQWPTDKAGWAAMFSGLADLGKRVFGSVATEVGVVSIAVRETSFWFWPKLLFGLLLMLACLLGIRRLLARWVLKNADQTGTTLPTAALSENLLRGMLPLSLLYLVWLLGIQSSELPLLLTLSLVWPTIALLTSLSRLMLLEIAPLDRAKQQAAYARRLAFFNRVRFVLWLSGGIAATTVIARAVPLSPAVSYAIDAVSMACLLVVSIPLLRMRILVRNANKRRRDRWTPLMRLLSNASLVIPLILLICAIVGLAGYVDLAWLVARHTAWLALVGSIVWILRGFLHDGTAALQRLASGANHSELFSQHLLVPARKVLLLALLAAAGWTLLQLFDPALSETLISLSKRVLVQPLFHFGEALITVQSILLTLLIVTAVLAGGRWLKQVSYHWPFSAIDDVGIRNSLATFVQYIVVLSGFVMGLQVIGVDLTALTIFAGALGVGIGLGLQNIANNFVSGILLLMERPLKSGDIVTVGPHEGAVVGLGLRSLTLRTWDQHAVIVPNANIISEPFTNWTHGDDVVRGITKVGISYDDDPHQAIALIEKILAESKLVMQTPEPRVMVWEFGASSIDLRIEFFCSLRGPLNRFQIRSQLLLAIWDCFRESGIRIPYPQQEIAFRKQEEAQLAVDND